MNRTIEQWQEVDCADAAYNDPREFISELLQDAVRDLQELARQRDELLSMLNGIDDAELLDVLGCENFNRYMDISKGNV